MRKLLLIIFFPMLLVFQCQATSGYVLELTDLSNGQKYTFVEKPIKFLGAKDKDDNRVMINEYISLDRYDYYYMKMRHTVNEIKNTAPINNYITFEKHKDTDENSIEYIDLGGNSGRFVANFSFDISKLKPRIYNPDEGSY